MTEPDRTGVGLGFAGDDIHHGGFTRAIGADDTSQFAGLDVKIQIINGFEPIKADRHVFQVKDIAMAYIQLCVDWWHEKVPHLIAAHGLADLIERLHPADSCVAAGAWGLLFCFSRRSKPAMP